MPTSPAPDAGAPPGMCPGVAVLGGGGGAGGSHGDGEGGAGGAGGSGSRGSEGAADDGKNVPDPRKYPDCGTASHPVDVVTGRAFTHPITDLELPGPLPLVLQRVYSSAMASRDVGLGFGWAHTLGWEIEVKRRSITVWNEQGVDIEFPMVPEGGEVIGPWAWLLRQRGEGFGFDTDDGLRRLFSIHDAGRKRYRLSAIEDRNGNRIKITHENDRLHEIEDSVGRIVRVRSTPEGRVSSIEVNNAYSQGQWVTFAYYTYNARGDLVSVIDAEGYPSQYEYDAFHRLTADTDRIGLCFRFVYDAQDRCIESWGEHRDKRDPSLIDDLPKKFADEVTTAKGIHHCKFEYHSGWYSEVADSTQVRRFFGNRHGTLDKSIIGSGVVTATYRDDGLQMARMDEAGAATIFERDERGRVVKVTAPLDRATVIERDAHGLPTRITDPAGGVTTFERDSRGNVVAATDATGGSTFYVYDERGLVTEEVSPTGARRICSYDAQGNLLVIADPSGGVWRFTYDALGRRLSSTDPLGHATRFTYSARGEVTAIYDADNGVTRYSYDGEGHLIQIEDPKGALTKLVWGGYHKLCSRKDANGSVVRLLYNLEGELVEVHNELGEVHRLAYDPSGQLIGEMTFDGRKLRYQNDLAGRLVRTENGLRQIAELTYDLAGQLIQRELDDGSIEEFSYNPRGELIGAKGPAGELRFERDAVGRVVHEAQLVEGGKEHWVESRYDSAGDRVRRTTSLGHTEVVQRGPLGERTRTVLDLADVVEHTSDTLGREVARELPRGGWIHNAYDAMGRVARRRAGGSGSQWKALAAEPERPRLSPEVAGIDTEYRYDLDGELIESRDRKRGITRYRYDPIGQLLAMVPEKARDELFRYNRAGNLYEDGPDAEPREYGAGNRLARKGSTEYTWDDDGRLVEKRERDPASGEVRLWRYEWNAAGLLREVEGPDGTVVDFAYDPFARRLQKRVWRPVHPGVTEPAWARRGRAPTSTTLFVWDGDVLAHEVTQQAREDGDPIVEERTYCFADESFEPMAHREARLDDAGWSEGEWFHYVNDPIGTPERLLTGNGEVACELKRSAWGKMEALPGANASTAIRFQGQYEDREVAFHYNRFRYYDPSMGRFIAPDPLGLEGGFNDYLYVTCPVLDIDPLGLKKKRNRKSDSEYFERFGSEEEAKSASRDCALSQKPGHFKQNKWIGDPDTVNYRTLGDYKKHYTHKMMIEAKPGTRTWLKQFETKASSEPNRYEIPYTRVGEFNSMLRSITVTESKPKRSH